MKEFIDAINFLRARLYYFEGLVVLFIITVYGYVYLASNAGMHLWIILTGLGVPAEYSDGAYLLGLLSMLLFVFLFWLHMRSVPKFKKGELGVLFAPKFPEDINLDVNSLMVSLNMELKSHQLNNQFSVKRLPPNLSITSAEEAENVIRRAGATTAVWGLMDSENRGGTKCTGFSRISFTFIHSPTHFDPNRHALIALSLHGKKYKYEERTQIADRSIVARDIGIVVRNLIGVSLFIDQKWSEVIKVFTPLFHDLAIIRVKDKSPPLQAFASQVGYDLAWAISMNSSSEYRGELFEQKLYSIPESELRKRLDQIKQAIKLDPQNSAHHFYEAIYYFLLGQCSDAIRSSMRGLKESPRALAVGNFSLAFLYNFNGNYEKSKKQYRIGMAKKSSYDEDLIEQCMVFISQSIKHFPEKKQLRLALATLDLKRGSGKEGASQLRELLADPPDSPKLKGFVPLLSQLWD